jgi:hypothetical protein
MPTDKQINEMMAGVSDNEFWGLQNAIVTLVLKSLIDTHPAPDKFREAFSKRFTEYQASAAGIEMPDILRVIARHQAKTYLE